MMDLVMPEGAECPEGCATRNDGSCRCEDLDLFDVAGQLENIF